MLENVRKRLRSLVKPIEKGRRITVFTDFQDTLGAGGTAKLELPPFGHTGPPKPALHMNASQETVHEGKLLYATHCLRCHGVNAVAGSLPDLRYATTEVHKQFSSIVLGGARESRGMPSFKDLLNETQVHEIEAYILSRAEESARPAVNEAPAPSGTLGALQ